ncbi:MAG: Na+/H+ antiporter NhaA [Novosphingobium sp.]|nr:Na+/H+ antiporter NhaA [Novosphingobium sp.]
MSSDAPSNVVAEVKDNVVTELRDNVIPDLRGKLREFVDGETAGGFMLMGAALLAMLLVNFGAADLYRELWHVPVAITVGEFGIDKSLLHWVNDGLMAVFFFLVGLEVKREILDGQLSTWSQASLPVFAAIGGMAVPAAVFILLNRDAPANLGGWAIPAATDIAFALGILAMLGKRVPMALKVLLLAIAIIDDIGAIIIIALFYTANLSTAALAGAGAVTVLLIVLNLAGVRRTPVFVLLGIAMWVFVLKSGVHATLAGVVTALAVPLAKDRDGFSPLESMEHALHPYVAYLILPLFAFANAGVSLAGLGLEDLLAPLPLGIALGLFLGKQIGVSAAIGIANLLRLAKPPAGVGWAQLYGLSCLTGVGFTMSLFIGSLAFAAPEQEDAVKLGVLAGSLASGILGFALLRLCGKAPGDAGAQETSPS